MAKKQGPVAGVLATGKSDPTQLAAAIFSASDEAMFITDANQVILAVNPAFERVTGYAAEEAIGQTPRLLSSGRHDSAFYDEMWKTLLASGHWHGEIWNRRKNGGLYIQRITISVLRAKDGTVANFVAVFSDITSGKQEVDRIRRMANYDSLTRLPNRTLLHDRIEQALAHAARAGGKSALLFLDLDGFKPVNDTLGHACGDRVLEIVAERLSGCVRESDTVARLGGDEFVILLPDVKSVADTEKLASKILHLLAQPIMLDKVAVRIGVSIGVALFPQHGANGDEMLLAADQAMYVAKKKGGMRFEIAR